MNEVTPKVTTCCPQKRIVAEWKSFVFRGFKKANAIRILFFVLALTACTHPMIGKTLPAANYPQFTSGSNGHHNINFERGIAGLDYEWSINNEKTSITLIGNYNVNTSVWHSITNSPYKSGKLIISAFLLNENYEILKVETIFIPIDPDTKLGKENTFSKIFPFNKEYKFITYEIRYEVSY